MSTLTLEKETISRRVDPAMAGGQPPAGYPISLPPWCPTRTPRSDPAPRPGHPGE